MHPIAFLRLQEKILDGYRVADIQAQEMFIPRNPMMRVVLHCPQSFIDADRAEREATAVATLMDEITQVYAARHLANMEAKAAEERDSSGRL